MDNNDEARGAHHDSCLDPRIPLGMPRAGRDELGETVDNTTSANMPLKATDNIPAYTTLHRPRRGENNQEN
jgi:hypothetical protein